jgi:hypothetical protein
MIICGSGTTVQAFNLVSTKAPKQPTKECMGQVLVRTRAYRSDVQKFRPLPGSRVRRNQPNPRAGGFVSAAPPAKALCYG